MTDFTGLELAQPILRAITDEGYTTPTPIQLKSIPALLEGRDLLGVAQTGTGKTAAFTLPLLHRLAQNGEKLKSRQPRALIIAPTRELAAQINDSVRCYGQHMHLRSTVVFGGASIRPQIQALNRGVHILVATPGRLLDLMNQRHLQLGSVETFILDEADRMLDMGFIPDVKKITAALPNKRQTLLFSATMPKSIEGLAASLLNDPVRVEVAPAATTVEKVEQHVLFVAKDKKRSLLGELLKNKDIARVLVFTRTKHGADRVVRHLQQCGVKSDAIHGNKAQNARQRALKSFRNGRIRALVATDIAARGIDVDGVTHVINFDLPNEPESYVHRIGRTARAGAGGIALSFCDHEERAYLRNIEKVIRQSVPVLEDQPFHAAEIANAPAPGKRSQQRKRNPNQRRRNPGRTKRAPKAA
ncbi:MAG: DEAD/DEAH box helicase [Rhodospirillaceae bacterium]|jgi:ATP-dependent RNA helicase RhlE|nr:DEAD/DEAH box helicase [Rhodospirillaceae bacterium]MBT3927868.1 DEAD/DEAH box helicase [Rhodospirillaceae bacterium]MBT4427927.1 DEAD/DEAH box helicase [Rhodospirillaceae bacterium]MBT5037214.1 DEAD/DEAH box helicase [Rhodospirillaceae bacterium]MBT5677789.1 DEAD/DEAH box helicase [Rhodospirillaceae bacterium]